jgi:hypothetical protein
VTHRRGKATLLDPPIARSDIGAKAADWVAGAWLPRDPSGKQASKGIARGTKPLQNRSA